MVGKGVINKQTIENIKSKGEHSVLQFKTPGPKKTWSVFMIKMKIPLL